jgi:hypothetical protein
LDEDRFIPRAFGPPFVQQFLVRRAGFVLAEAVSQCVAQPLEAEILRAPRIASVEKRTVILGLSHATTAEAAQSRSAKTAGKIQKSDSNRVEGRMTKPEIRINDEI